MTLVRQVRSSVSSQGYSTVRGMARSVLISHSPCNSGTSRGCRDRAQSGSLLSLCWSVVGSDFALPIIDIRFLDYLYADEK